MIRRWRTSNRNVPQACCLSVSGQANGLFAYGWWVVVVWWGAVLAILPQAGHAQPGRIKPVRTLPPLSYRTPGDAGLFVEIDRPLAVSTRLGDGNVWPALVQFIGGNDASWQRVLVETLGVESNTALARMFGERVALAAPDWRRLDEGVILFTQSDPKLLRSIVQPDRVRSAKPVKRVAVIQSKTGLWVAIHGRMVVLSQKRGPGTLFDKCIALLNQQSRHSLATSKTFRKCFTGLPFPRDACAFWTTAEPPGKTADQPISLSRWWLPIRSGALSVRVRSHQLELAFQGVRSGQQNREYKPRVRLDRIVALPQTTLGTWSTSIDARELFDTACSTSPPAQLSSLWAMLKDNADADLFQEEVIANVGPRCMVFIAADFTTDNLSPQVGFMIESVDASAVVEVLRGFVEQIVEAVDVGEDEVPPIRLSTSSHRGLTIHELHVVHVPTDRSGQTLASLIVENMTLSFATVQGWIIVSTSPEHVRQVIDANKGLAPRFGEILKLDKRNKQLRKSVSAAVLQPSFALGTLRYWNTLLRDRRRAARGRARLGVSVHTTPRPGQVAIADIHSNGPSVGVLEPGDSVIACNGRLLDMDSANEHLKMLLAQAPSDKPIRLRFLRNGEFHEETIEPLQEEVPDESQTGITTLLEHLTPLEEIALQLSMAIYSVERPSGNAHHARLLLDFERSGTSAADTEAAASSSP